MLPCRHRGGHVRLLSQLYHPRHLEYRSSWYVVYEYSTAVSNTVSSLRAERIKQTWNDWNDDCSELNRFSISTRINQKRRRKRTQNFVHIRQVNLLYTLPR